MGALEYPREWFRASNWGDQPFARTFARETEAFLICDDGRRCKKWTDYDRWYPTREEAQAVIDKRIANEAERERMNRIRDAAHELLVALQAMMPDNLCADNPNIPDNAVLPVDFHYGDLRRAKAAIAKARGEVA